MRSCAEPERLSGALRQCGDRHTGERARDHLIVTMHVQRRTIDFVSHSGPPSCNMKSVRRGGRASVRCASGLRGPLAHIAIGDSGARAEPLS